MASNSRQPPPTVPNEPFILTNIKASESRGAEPLVRVTLIKTPSISFSKKCVRVG